MSIKRRVASITAKAHIFLSVSDLQAIREYDLRQAEECERTPDFEENYEEYVRRFKVCVEEGSMEGIAELTSEFLEREPAAHYLRRAQHFDEIIEQGEGLWVKRKAGEILKEKARTARSARERNRWR